MRSLFTRISILVPSVILCVRCGSFPAEQIYMLERIHTHTQCGCIYIYIIHYVQCIIYTWRERPLDIERGRNRLHLMENSLLKRVWISHKTDYGMNEWMKELNYVTWHDTKFTWPTNQPKWLTKGGDLCLAQVNVPWCVRSFLRVTALLASLTHHNYNWCLLTLTDLRRSLGPRPVWKAFS